MTAKQEIHDKGLVTKHDIKSLELKIEQTKSTMIFWVSGIIGTFGVFSLGVMAKGFHWI